MTSTHPRPSLAMAVPVPGTYLVDPARSTVTFSMRHMFGLGGVSGSFQVRSGSITIADPPAGSSVRGEVDAASFRTGNKVRDRQVISGTFLDAGSFPVISFRSTSLRRADPGWILAGELTARGAKAPAEFTITHVGTTRDGDLTVSAEGSVDRYQHRITAMKGMAGRRLRIRLAVTAKPA